MDKLEIDYSGITSPENGLVANEWEAPPRKYFGKKLPNGKMEKEPVYTHVEFPRMMYRMNQGKIVAKVFQSEQAVQSAGEEWEKTPAAFGYIGAPSHEQHLALQGSAAADETVVESVQSIQKPRGRPRKENAEA